MTYVMKLAEISPASVAQEVPSVEISPEPLPISHEPVSRQQVSDGEEIETFTVNGVTFEMIKVEGGSFLMGSDSGESNEKPVHSETVGTPATRVIRGGHVRANATESRVAARANDMLSSHGGFYGQRLAL